MEESQERHPRHVDQDWAEKLLIAAHCQEALAGRERTLRERSNHSRGHAVPSTCVTDGVK
jgi:hypothetical protein